VSQLGVVGWSGRRWELVDLVPWPARTLSIAIIRAVAVQPFVASAAVPVFSAHLVLTRSSRNCECPIPTVNPSK
jgi:hypothetical protein